MIDLHTHSVASDGSDTPSELIGLALEKKLAGIALTDHDTLSGLPEFLACAQGKDIVAIPGLEISSSLYNKEIHILGLFIDPSSEKLENFLLQTRQNRNTRNGQILEKLNIMGYEISIEELEDFARGESVGRPHLARLLVKKGYFESIQDAFDHCLRRGARAYSPRVLAPPEESIRVIHEAGGLAFWAHPVYRSTGGERSFVRRYLRRLVPLGLDGIEGFYSLFSVSQHTMIMEMAKEFNILVSGGSDYHGLNQPSIQLGAGCGSLEVPDGVLDAILARRAVR